MKTLIMETFLPWDFTLLPYGLRYGAKLESSEDRLFRSLKNICLLPSALAQFGTLSNDEYTRIDHFLQTPLFEPCDSSRSQNSSWSFKIQSKICDPTNCQSRLAKVLWSGGLVSAYGGNSEQAGEICCPVPFRSPTCHGRKVETRLALLGTWRWYSL